jgi:probable O-glycosylation ligase (exosortase A-associated)
MADSDDYWSEGSLTRTRKGFKRPGLDEELKKPASRREPSAEPDGLSNPFGTNRSFDRPKENFEKPTARSETLSKPAEPAFPLRRGHAISYAGLFLFTLVLYFRPYEWIPAFAALDRLALYVAIATLIVFIPSQFALEGNLTARPREVHLVLLLCLTALLSIPFAFQPGLAWDTFFNKEFIRAVLMFIVIVNVVRTERRLKGLVFLSVAVSCYLSVFALRDYRAGLAQGENRIWGVIGGMFGNPNDLALHLVTVVPIAIGLLLSSRRLLIKFIYGICAALFVAAIIITFSRGGFLGLIVVAGVLAWKLGRQHKLRTIIFTSVFLLIFVVFAPGNYGLRILSIFDSSLDPTGSASARSTLLTLSIRVALRHPLFGVGMGNFNFMSAHEQVNHNSYLQIATELGLAAFAFYVLFIVVPIRRLRKIERDTFELPRRDRKFFYLAVGLQAGLIGYMVCSFFASVAYQFYVYYLVGYAVAFWRIYEAQRGPKRTAVPEST